MKKLPLKKNRLIAVYFEDKKYKTFYCFLTRYETNIENTGDGLAYHIIKFENVYLEQNIYLPMNRYTFLYIQVLD